jgi:hypothetical protein
LSIRKTAEPRGYQTPETASTAIGVVRDSCFDHPDVATSLNNLAGFYRDQHDYARALPLLERASAIAETALGGNHPTAQVLRKNLEICRSLVS